MKVYQPVISLYVINRFTGKDRITLEKSWNAKFKIKINVVFHELRYETSYLDSSDFNMKLIS